MEHDNDEAKGVWWSKGGKAMYSKHLQAHTHSWEMKWQPKIGKCIARLFAAIRRTASIAAKPVKMDGCTSAVTRMTTIGTPYQPQDLLQILESSNSNVSAAKFGASAKVNDGVFMCMPRL
jgi:hypothetical protein